MDNGVFTSKLAAIRPRMTHRLSVIRCSKTPNSLRSLVFGKFPSPQRRDGQGKLPEIPFCGNNDNEVSLGRRVSEDFILPSMSAAASDPFLK